MSSGSGMGTTTGMTTDPTTDLTMSLMTDDEAIFKLAIVALVLVGVLAVALVIVTVVLGYCIYRCRKEVEIKLLSKLFLVPCLSLM